MVKNELPTSPSDGRLLAIVGEAPGQHEVTARRPFVGPSGQLLNAALQRNQMPRSMCFVGNVCQQRPPNNDITQFDWDGDDIQSGLLQLKLDLDRVNPNVILLLGRSALKAAGIHHPITSFRGSVFECQDDRSPMFGHKCIASIHPAAILREYSYNPLFLFDVKRAVSQARSPDLILPNRTLNVDMSAGEAYYRLRGIQAGAILSIDIEGGIVHHETGKPTNVSVIAIATGPNDAFTINLRDYSLEAQSLVMLEFSRVMRDPTIFKILQNCLYDNFVLTWLWHIPINGIIWDTMLSGWELYPELMKGLATQTSIYTLEPYYKFEKKITDNRTHYLYCAKDAAVTFEIAEVHNRLLKGPSREHYERNMKLLAPVMFMELKGFKIDVPLKTELTNEIKTRMAEILARIHVGCGVELNPNSPTQMKALLYGRMGYPKQQVKEHGRLTDKVTTDKGALLNIMRTVGKDPFLLNILYYKHFDGKRKQLEMDIDGDGRVRGSYNIVGSETGRFASYSSPTGTGTNLQTITEDVRVIFMADPGYTMFNFDFMGSDGWTVAAHCLTHGDSTMMDDYLHGIKPAKVIAAMYLRGAAISKLNRLDLQDLIKSLDIPEWLYFVCKRVQHGTSYALGPVTMSDQIMKDSWDDLQRPIYKTSKECTALQALFHFRYPGIKKWHDACKKLLEDTGKFTCCDGNTRQFFGRRHDHETFREFLAHEPQHNTTDATTRSMIRLWEDPENRDPVTFAPIVQPIHQVHDALIGQFPSELRSWAIPKLMSYVQNSLTISGQQITIPVELKLGPNWLNLKAV